MNAELAVQIVAGKLDGTMFSKAGAEELMAASFKAQANGANSHNGTSNAAQTTDNAQIEKAETREMAVAARASSRVLQSLPQQVSIPQRADAFTLQLFNVWGQQHSGVA